jgi:membrane protein DedA with SNARE-associated domain
MARFMPGLRTPIFMTCGIYQVSFWKFLTLDGLAALISVPVWVYVGVIFGENLELLEQKIRQFQVGIYSLLGGLIALGILYAIVKKKFMNKVISAPDDQDPSSTS